jgi:hypothetical protein
MKYRARRHRLLPWTLTDAQIAGMRLLEHKAAALTHLTARWRDLFDGLLTT